jgi:Fe-S oxidoreductase
MCPSYRVTRNERDLTRGRANSLRLALSGQLDRHGLSSDDLYETMELCVSCKGCRRECPTGVDMAAMKTEFLYQYHQSKPRSLSDRLIAHLPRYAPTASRLSFVANARDRVPGLARLSESLTGLSASRSLPRWHSDAFRGQPEVADTDGDADVVLLVDTFNRWFEPDNLRAAVRVLQSAGCNVIVPEPADGGRPLCCGRTYLASGMIDEARAEVQRLSTALRPYVERGVPVIGLEPSCLLGLRDELPLLLPGDQSRAIGRLALTFEEYLQERVASGSVPEFGPVPYSTALVHGHCHQKAFDVMSPVTRVLGLIPDLDVEVINSGCCGMAGAFGYKAKTLGVSKAMAEASLLPAVRAAASDTTVIADGTSCRHQVRDFGGRQPQHVATLLAESLQA